MDTSTSGDAKACAAHDANDEQQQQQQQSSCEHAAEMTAQCDDGDKDDKRTQPSPQPDAGSNDEDENKATAATAAVDAAAAARLQVAALYAEHGDAHLQKRLREVIAQVKKRQSELAQLSKRNSAAGRQVAALQESHAKALQLRRKGEEVCRTLQDALRRRRELTQRLCAEMQQHRSDVQRRVDDGLAETTRKLVAREEAVAQQREGNAQLRDEVEQHRRAFDSACAAFQDNLRTRAQSIEGVLRGCSATARELETVEGQLLLVRRERAAAESAAAMLREQVAAYDGQYDEFAQTAMTPDDVVALAQRQRAHAEERVAVLEREKAEAHELRVRLTKETTELRARAAALTKRELPQAEKARAAAERRCRAAQQQLRSDTSSSGSSSGNGHAAAAAAA